MAPSFLQPQQSLPFSPTLHQFIHPSHSLGADKRSVSAGLPIQNPKLSHQADPHFLRSTTRVNLATGNGASEPPSTEDRLGQLEAFLPMILDIHQREIADLRSEIEALKSQASLKPALNKNASTFVPAPGPATPTTPASFHKLTPSSSSSIAASGPPTPLSASPPTSAFDALPQHSQIYSLSQQVNVISATMSQLLTTLLASPGPVTVSNAAPLPMNTGSVPLLNPAPHPRPPPRANSTGAVALSSPLAPQNPSNTLHRNSTFSPPTSHVRTLNRHPGNLHFRPPTEFLSASTTGLDSSLSSPQLPFSPTLAHSDARRALLLGPHTSATCSSPLSPAPFDIMPSGGLAPVNSLAGKWEQLGITGDVLRAIVRFGIGPPTKTQQKSIPSMLLGKDLVSQSNPIQERIQSYVIPALQLIMNDLTGSQACSGNPGNPSQRYRPSLCPPPAKPNTSVKVLVITATLDEASQAHRLASGIAALLPTPLRIGHCGATDSHPEQTAVNGVLQHPQPHMLVGTPPKLLDPVNGLRGYTFDEQAFICVILDEMDQLLARNLSDMVTSLMTFLPSNAPISTSCPDVTSSGPPSSSGSGGRMDNPQVVASETFNPSDEWGLSPSPHQSPPQISVSASPPSLSEIQIHSRSRQTCIFSCTVPQDVLSYARTLNLKARVLVRREETGNSTPAAHGAVTPVAANFDMGDHKAPNIPSSLMLLNHQVPQATNNASLLKQLTQLCVTVRPGSLPGVPVRERKIQALLEMLSLTESEIIDPTSPQSILIYCNSVDSVEAVSRALGQHGIHSMALHQDMGPAARHSLINKFGQGANLAADSPGHISCPSARAWVIYDALAKTLLDTWKDQPSLVINFELPRAVEDYIHRAGCLLNGTPSNTNKKPNSHGFSGSILLNLVSPGYEFDMIKSIESFYRCKIQEVVGGNLLQIFK